MGELAVRDKADPPAEKRSGEREEESRPDKWSRPASKGSYGKGRHWGDWGQDKSADGGQSTLS